MHKRANIIGKQYVDISFDGATDAFAFRDHVSWVCTTKLLPAIDKLFDELSPAGKVYYFEKLIVDVGDLPADNWEAMFVEKVVAGLLANISSTSSSFTPDRSSVDKALLPKPVANLGQEMQEIESIRQTIFYFLRTGLLPWNASVKNTNELCDSLKRMTDDPRALKQLIQLINADNRALNRLIQQIDDEVLDVIILHGGVAKNMLSELKVSLAVLMELTQVPPGGKRLSVYKALLSNISDYVSACKDEFESSVIESILERISRPALCQALQLSGDCSDENLIEVFNNKTDQIIYSKEIRSEIQSSVKRKIFERGRPEVLDHEGKDRPTGKPTSKADAKSMDADEVFINNAGLVLLHPFLALLFENVGYTEKKVWISDETHERAIVLTQYMVTGIDMAPEFDLFLNKLLMGYSIEKTLPLDIRLSDFEKQEADDVLRSVIKHWPALKNTSIDGLRSAFLVRDGRVFRDDSRWNLKVEQKTIDILMNRLPWGISIIKTPWMETMMKVEWT